MSIVLLVNPNGKNGTPKVWGYDTADNGRVFFGSIQSTWQARAINGIATEVEREKKQEGYISVGQFADKSTAERFKSAWNETRLKGHYPYLANDPTQSQFASALKTMGYKTSPTNATPSAAAPVAPPPAKKPATKRATASFFKSVDAEVKRLNKDSMPDVLEF